jgi:peptide/nickel transport system permease protein
MQLSQPPSAAHWLGTDPYGRDVLADVLAGTRTFWFISLPAAVLASVLGGVLGAGAGYWGNTGLRLPSGSILALGAGGVGALLSVPAVLPWWLAGTTVAVAVAAYSRPFGSTRLALPLDRLVLGAAALLGSVPRLILVLLLAAAHAPSARWLLAVLAGTCWPATARLVRTLVQQLRRQPYIEAGYAAGYSDARLLLGHILPNIWPSVRASLPLNLSICLGLQTSLAFLGVGLPPDQADWGRTLANARLEPGAWWLVVAGVGPLVVTMTALHQLLPHKTGLSRASQSA